MAPYVKHSINKCLELITCIEIPTSNTLKKSDREYEEFSVFGWEVKTMQKNEKKSSVTVQTATPGSFLWNKKRWTWQFSLEQPPESVHSQS